MTILVVCSLCKGCCDKFPFASHPKKTWLVYTGDGEEGDDDASSNDSERLGSTWYLPGAIGVLEVDYIIRFDNRGTSMLSLAKKTRTARHTGFSFYLSCREA